MVFSPPACFRWLIPLDHISSGHWTVGSSVTRLIHMRHLETSNLISPLWIATVWSHKEQPFPVVEPWHCIFLIIVFYLFIYLFLRKILCIPAAYEAISTCHDDAVWCWSWAPPQPCPLLPSHGPHWPWPTPVPRDVPNDLDWGCPWLPWLPGWPCHPPSWGAPSVPRPWHHDSFLGLSPFIVITKELFSPS